MNLYRLSPVLIALVVVSLVGCGSDEMSAADQKKMRDAMAPGKTNFGTMTSDQKSGFEKWKAGGGAQAPSAPGPTK